MEGKQSMIWKIGCVYNGFWSNNMPKGDGEYTDIFGKKSLSMA